MRHLILHCNPESMYMYVCIFCESCFRNAINSCACANNAMSIQGFPSASGHHWLKVGSQYDAIPYVALHRLHVDTRCNATQHKNRL